MRDGFKIIDSDIHVIEPSDLYERYLDKRYLPHAPTYVTGPEQRTRHNWLLEMPGREERIPQINLGEGFRSVREDQLGDTLDDAIEDDYGPNSTLRAMDLEGVDIAAVFRTWAQGHVSIDGLDPQFANALYRAYNNWLADFCSTDPGRLKGVALISLHDIDLAVKEVRRAVNELGMVGVTLEPNPLNGRFFHDPECDPLWNECQELNVPVCFHDTNVGYNASHHANFMRAHPNPGVMGNTFAFPTGLQQAIGSLTLGGVFDRFPSLRAAFLEGNFSWVPWLLWRLDEQWELYGGGEDVMLKKNPSEYFLSQCVLSCEAGESIAKHAFAAIGNDNVVLSTDFPHLDSPFPHAIETFLGLPDISDETKRKALWDNCVWLYALNGPDLEATIKRTGANALVS